MKKIITLFLLLAVALSLFACGNLGGSNKAVKATIVTNSGETKQMTLEEIKEIVKTNTLLFEKEYAGADITVTSTITKIGGSFELTSWFKCEAYVELDAADSIGCWFHPVTEEHALTLKVGDKITVSGKIGLATSSGFDVYILYDKISPYGDNKNTNNNGNNQTPPNEDVWITGNYVDEFDSPTGMAYVATKNYLIGTFSNSATTDSKLYAQMLVDIENGKPRVAIFLYEYGNNLVKNSYSKANEYEIVMQCSNGNKVNLKGFMYSGHDRIFIEEAGARYGNANSVISELCSSGESMKLYVVDADRTTTEYLFAVPKSNFQEQYKKISNGVIPGGNSGGSNGGKPNENDHTHEWLTPTCTEPKTCRICGVTSGNALGHNYSGDTCTRCGSPLPNFANPEVGYDGSKVTITFYHTMGSALQNVLECYIAEFNKLYPNITIKHVRVGSYDDVYARIQTELASGSGPNIAYCYPEHIATYNQYDSVVSLDGLIASTIEYTDIAGQKQILGLSLDQINNFIPGFYEEGRQFGDNLMYSLPLSKSTEVMYYDKTFFEANGLQVPTTWDEMEVLCEKILEIDPNCIPFAYDSESNWFITMCAQSGSNYTSAAGEHYLFDNATNRDFVARFRQWYQKGYFTTQQLYGGYASELFTASNGKRCYMAIGSTGGAMYHRPNNSLFEVGIASIPQVNVNNPKAISQGPNLCIFQSEDYQEVIASWLFLKFLTTNEAFQAEFSMVSGYMPVIQSVLENSYYKQFLSSANGYSNLSALATKVAMEQTKCYFTPSAFLGSSEARTIVGELIVDAVSKHSVGDDNALIEKLFKDAVARCKDPSADSSDSNRVLIYSTYYGEYATDTEYLYTSSNGTEKIELALGSKSQALILTLKDNGDGTVSFQLDNGMYLYCDGNDVTFSTSQSDYTKFVLEKVSDGYYIRCAVANYNGKPQYLEVYRGYLTCYSISSASDLSMYTFKLENIN